MSNKEIVLACFISRNNILDFITDELKNRIEYKYESYSNIIRTKNVDVRCKIIPVQFNQRDHVCGLRCDTCFGFNKETEDYLTRGKGVSYSGYLIDYILEKNGVKK